MAIDLPKASPVSALLCLAACFICLSSFPASGKSEETLSVSRLWEEKSNETNGLMLSNDELKADSKEGGNYYGIMTVPSFDRITVKWTGKGNLKIFLRVQDDDPNNVSDWQPISGNGGSYLYRMDGILSFQPFKQEPQYRNLEIHAEFSPGTSLQEITLDFSKEENNAKSTLVLIVVMLLSGCVLYLKKRRIQDLQ